MLLKTPPDAYRKLTGALRNAFRGFPKMPSDASSRLTNAPRGAFNKFPGSLQTLPEMPSEASRVREVLSEASSMLLTLTQIPSEAYWKPTIAARDAAIGLQCANKYS